MSAHAATRKPKTMTKALAAVGAAAVLGAGLFTANGGSFALWEDTATLGNEVTIQSGKLQLVEGDEGAWTVASESSESRASAIDLSDFLMVPGDKLQYTQKIRLEAEGTNLDADLQVSMLELIAEAGSTDLKDALVVTVAATNAEGGSVSRVYTTNGEEFTGRLALLRAQHGAWFNGDVTVTVTVELPDSVNETNAQGMSVQLKPVTVSATQVR